MLTVSDCYSSHPKSFCQHMKRTEMTSSIDQNTVSLHHRRLATSSWSHAGSHTFVQAGMLVTGHGISTCVTLALFMVLVLPVSGGSLAWGVLKVGDICRLKGQERNTLQGMGLVVGLKGTGDGAFSPTALSLMQIMNNMGIPMTSGVHGERYERQECGAGIERRQERGPGRRDGRSPGTRGSARG